MAQTSFKFKQFNILNKNCAMPVGTDAVLLGSWAECPVNAGVLDIGSGSGIISLMLAQRFDSAHFTGIEIHKESFEESLINVKNSPWADRIDIKHANLQGYLSSTERYDLILSNPPFFERTTLKDGPYFARDSAAMPIDTLSSASGLLSSTGTMAVIGPLDYMASLQKSLHSNGLHPQRELLISGTLTSEVKRRIVQFGHEIQGLASEHLVIEPKRRHEYSSRYKELTQDFYLD